MSSWPLVAPPPPPGAAPAATPALGVVVAAYQAAATIGASIESVLAQTRPACEIVVCDDGSTDDLAGELARFGDAVRLVSRPNGGEAAAKNTAVAAATTEWVCVLDADDTYLPEYLEAVSSAIAARPDLDVVTCDAWVEAGGRRIRRAYSGGFVFAADGQRVAILERNFVFGLAAVRRAAWLAAGGFDERLRFMSDWEFFQRLILGGSRVGCIQAPLARYSLTSENLSADREGMLAGRMTILAAAAARDDLSCAERAVVARAQAETAPRLARETALRTLAGGQTGARRAAVSAARAPGQARGTRVKLAAAAVAPRLAGRLFARRPPLSAGGTSIPRAADDPTAREDADRSRP